MTIIFQNFVVFRDFLHFCTVFKTWKVCTPNSILLKQNYFLSNFWLHIFKSVEYRKLANIRKSMQIRKPVVPKNFKKCLSILLVKWVYHKLYIFQFLIFDTNWPSLLSIQTFISCVKNYVLCVLLRSLLRTLRSFTFFAKERWVLLRSLQKNVAFFALFSDL